DAFRRTADRIRATSGRIAWGGGPNMLALQTAGCAGGCLRDICSTGRWRERHCRGFQADENLAGLEVSRGCGIGTAVPRRVTGSRRVPAAVGDDAAAGSFLDRAAR